MPKPDVDPLTKQLAAITAFDMERLIRREKWGEINFDGARHDLDRIFKIATTLSVLPLDQLADDTRESIRASCEAAGTTFGAIDGFTIQTGNPPQERDNLVTQVKQRADHLFKTASQWIPFLAYQKGDVAANIQSLTDSVTAAKQIVDDARGEIEQRHNEIETIIIKAREASAAAGAAVFTRDFLSHADELRTNAKSWLRITAGMAIATVGLAVYAAFATTAGLDGGQLAHRLIGKFAIIGILVTATLWCGRIYKALMHQSAVNRHRSLSIQTLQAFANAATDPQAKDAVLLEAAKAVFANTPSGYIDSKDMHHDTSVKVFDVAKSLMKSDG